VLQLPQPRSGPTTVLVVDDEPIVREIVVRALRRNGFTTLEATDGPEARRLIETTDPSLVILDVVLPGTDGLELCRWIRCRFDLPVIVLSARSGEADRIAGLEHGADDYITKPFSPGELAARVRTVLRRANPPASAAAPAGQLRIGELVIDRRSREVRRRGAAVALTAREFDLLSFLAAHPRRVFSRAQLMERVWGYAAALDTGTVTVHIRRLREKIEPDPGRPIHVQTVWGIGYRFDP
jgi:DNA-binding response OmpR family regulator